MLETIKSELPTLQAQAIRAEQDCHRTGKDTEIVITALLEILEDYGITLNGNNPLFYKLHYNSNCKNLTFIKEEK
jgi:hypothetical protein